MLLLCICRRGNLTIADKMVSIARNQTLMSKKLDVIRGEMTTLGSLLDPNIHRAIWTLLDAIACYAVTATDNSETAEKINILEGMTSSGHPEGKATCPTSVLLKTTARVFNMFLDEFRVSQYMYCVLC